MMRLFVMLIILVAIGTGAFAMVVAIHRDSMENLIIFRNFFEGTIPILVFGALIKFLCVGACNCNCQKK